MPRFCTNCGFELPEGAKFCQECGVKVAPEVLEAGAAPPEPAAVGFTIEFNASSSANYPFAVERASSHPSYSEQGEGKKKVHRVTYSPSDVEELVELLEALKGFRNRRVWVNGEKTMWEQAFGWSWCYSRRNSSYIPELYCFGETEDRFNLWGCIWSGMHFGRFTKWLTYGRFSKDGTFAFDKDRIKHELTTALYKQRLCPAFSAQLVEDVLAAFPDQVNPKQDKDWDFQVGYGASEMPGSLAIGAKHPFARYETRAVGVHPKSLEAARKIFVKIGRKLPAPKDLKFD